MDAKANGVENAEQGPKEQARGWIWQYFVLRGNEPWSGLQTHRLAEIVVSKGSSNCQASEMQELKEYFDAITDKQVVKDAVSFHDAFRDRDKDEADNVESSKKAMVSWH